jgi:hypothetical protein
LPELSTYSSFFLNERASVTPEEQIMADGDPNVETPRQKLAQTARQNDMQASSESARNATQYAILINGGAATAILSFLSKTPNSDSSSTLHAAALSGLGRAAAWSLVGYALGVCFAAISMWCSSQASAKFGLKWESFLDSDRPAENRFMAEGDRWLRLHRNFFTASILLFFGSTVAMAWGLWPAAKQQDLRCDTLHVQADPRSELPRQDAHRALDNQPIKPPHFARSSHDRTRRST